MNATAVVVAAVVTLLGAWPWVQLVRRRPVAAVVTVVVVAAFSSHVFALLYAGGVPAAVVRGLIPVKDVAAALLVVGLLVDRWRAHRHGLLLAAAGTLALVAGLAGAFLHGGDPVGLNDVVLSGRSLVEAPMALAAGAMLLPQERRRVLRLSSLVLAAGAAYALLELLLPVSFLTDVLQIGPFWRDVKQQPEFLLGSGNHALPANFFTDVYGQRASRRLSGAFGDPLSAGTTLAFGLVATVSTARRWQRAAGVLLFAVALYLTRTRAGELFALAGVAPMVGLFCWQQASRAGRQGKAALIGAVVVVGGGAAAVAGETFVRRQLDRSNGSTSSHLTALSATVNDHYALSPPGLGRGGAAVGAATESVIASVLQQLGLVAGVVFLLASAATVFGVAWRTWRPSVAAVALLAVLLVTWTVSEQWLTFNAGWVVGLMLAVGGGVPERRAPEPLAPLTSATVDRWLARSSGVETRRLVGVGSLVVVLAALVAHAAGVLDQDLVLLVTVVSLVADVLVCLPSARVGFAYATVALTFVDVSPVTVSGSVSYLRAYQAMSLLLPLCLLGTSGTQPAGWRPRWSVLGWLGVLTALNIASFAVTTSSSDTVQVSLGQAYLLALALGVVLLVRRQVFTVPGVLLALLAGCTLGSVSAVVEFVVSQAGHPLHVFSQSGIPWGRPGGLMREPDWSGLTAAIGLFLTVFDPLRSRLGRWVVPSATLQVVVLGLTLVRSVLVAVVVTALVLVVLPRVTFRVRWVSAALLAVVVVGSGALLVASPSLGARLDPTQIANESGDGGAGQSRLGVYRLVLHDGPEKLALGHGAGSIAAATLNVDNRIKFLGGGDLNTGHGSTNLVASTFYDLGLPGLLAVLGLMAAWLWRAWRSSAASLLPLALLCLVTFQLTNGFRFGFVWVLLAVTCLAPDRETGPAVPPEQTPERERELVGA